MYKINYIGLRYLSKFISQANEIYLNALFTVIFISRKEGMIEEDFDVRNRTIFSFILKVTRHLQL